MKHYSCKYCGFSGTRIDVRLHLRKEHRIRGLLKSAIGERLPSQLTKSTKIKEINDNINERINNKTIKNVMFKPTGSIRRYRN